MFDRVNTQIVRRKYMSFYSLHTERNKYCKVNLNWLTLIIADDMIILSTVGIINISLWWQFVHSITIAIIISNCVDITFHQWVYGQLIPTMSVLFLRMKARLISTYMANFLMDWHYKITSKIADDIIFWSIH